MKFLHEMIARKKQARAEGEFQVTEVEYDGFADPGMPAPLSEVRAAAAEAKSEQTAPAEARRPAFGADEGSYDWDMSGIDMGPDGDDAPLDLAAHHIPAPEPEETPEPALRAVRGFDATGTDARMTAAEFDDAGDGDDGEEDHDAAFAAMSEVEAEAPEDGFDDLAAEAGDMMPEDDAFEDDPADIAEAEAVAEAADPAPKAPEPLRLAQPKIWDMPGETASDPAPAATPGLDLGDAAAAALLRNAPKAHAPSEPLRRAAPEVKPPSPFAPPPAADSDGDGAPRRKAGRVKTRLLGFHKPDSAEVDPISAASAAPSSQASFPVGWLIVLKGPGRGASFTLCAGASKIGRGEDQAVRLDFGDLSISRDNHAVIAYDDEQRRFFMGHGGKANLVRLNGMPVLATEPLTDGDMIRIGETSLKFVALCGPDFSWEDAEETDERHAAFN